MKKVLAASILAIFVVSFVILAEGAAEETGAISGRISPRDASVQIIAKTAGTEHRVKGNIKGEVTLTQGGNFTIKGLASGKYDLLFFLQGKSQEKYFTTRWSEIIVQAAKITSGINYRLTPRSSEHLIDEVLVAFKNTKAEDARKTISSTGCVIKDTPLQLGKTTIYTVDIPDDKSVDDMIQVFKKKRGVEYAEPNGIVTID